MITTRRLPFVLVPRATPSRWLTWSAPLIALVLTLLSGMFLSSASAATWSSTAPRARSSTTNMRYVTAAAASGTYTAASVRRTAPTTSA